MEIETSVLLFHPLLSCQIINGQHHSRQDFAPSPVDSRHNLTPNMLKRRLACSGKSKKKTIASRSLSFLTQFIGENMFLLVDNKSIKLGLAKAISTN